MRSLWLINPYSLPTHHRFEAMLYFLYTGEISFAPYFSDPAQTRTGDWTIAKLPSPSAKSIYRLADMVTSLVCLRRPFGSLY